MIAYLCLLIFCLSSGNAEDVSIRFSSSNYGLLEEKSDSYARLEVEKIGATMESFTVIIELVSRHGTESDFTSSSWTVFFPGSMESNETQTVDLFVVDDDIPEDDETYRVQLTANRGFVMIGSPGETTITIPANDDANGIVSFSSDSPIVGSETAGKDEAIIISVKRERGTFGNVTLKYGVKSYLDKESLEETVDDLYPASGSFIIPEGKDSTDFEIFVKDDELPENDEKFTIILLSTDKGKIKETNNTIEVIVKGNDSPLRFLHETLHVLEDVGKLNVTVLRGLDKTGTQRVGPDTGEVVVDYFVTANSATAGKDYHLQQQSTVRFKDQVHHATIEVFIIDDNSPEVAENFTITLRANSVMNDAIVASPDSCIVTIETNDKANGVLSFDFSNAVSVAGNAEEKVYIINEDDMNSFSGIRILRHGGSFQTVSIDWELKIFNETETRSRDQRLVPTAGSVVFRPGESEKHLMFSITEDDIPQEAMSYTLSLLPNTVVGGAELDETTSTLIYVPDSDDAYGIINILAGDEHEIFQGRSVHFTISRIGGTIGSINITYLAYYLPRGESDIRNAMPGIFQKPNGAIVMEDGIASKDLILDIEQNAFLQTGAFFDVRLNGVELSDRVPILPSHTPALGENYKLQILVSEEYANSEVGFANSSELAVEEPNEEDGPFTVVIEITREGLSSETVVHISYRNEEFDGQHVTVDVDYTPGEEQIKFEPGQRSATLNVLILPDDNPEIDEMLVVRLDRVHPDNQKLKKDATEKVIIIKENDSPGGIFQFAENTTKLFEIKEDKRESAVVTIIRSEGDLAMRMVMCDVTQGGSEQFYGVPEISVFLPGQRSATISIIPKDDNIPELEETFTLELHSHGIPPSELGSFIAVDIKVSQSDDPHGVFVMGEKLYDDLKIERQQVIQESTTAHNYMGHFVIERQMGSFGEVSVTWKVFPENTEDIHPTSGTMIFGDLETEAILDLTSSTDDEPESMEEFSVVLVSATGGARIGNQRNASLIIEANDKAINFEGSSSVSIEEGQNLTLSIRRDGTGSDNTKVYYKTRSRVSSDDTPEDYHLHPAAAWDDYVPVPNNVTSESDLIYLSMTNLVHTVNISVPDDGIPEDNEEFFVELYNATGDYVVHGNTALHVTIVLNDDACGVFRLSSTTTANMEEGIPYVFRIQRDYGTYRNVSAYWKIISHSATNDRTLKELIQQSEKVSDFIADEGVVEFLAGENEKSFKVIAVKDLIPEYDEKFILVLTNVSGGSARLAANRSELMVDLVVGINDHPYGKIEVGMDSREVFLAEDRLKDGETISDIAFAQNVTIERTFGTDGNINVLWEIYDPDFDVSSLPRCRDLLLAAEKIGDIVEESVRHRANSTTVTYRFKPGSHLEVHDIDQLTAADLVDGFSLSLWVMPDISSMHSHSENLNMDHAIVPFISKHDKNGTIYSTSLHLWGNPEEGQVTAADVILIYRTTEMPDIEKQIVCQIKNPVELFQDWSTWTYIVININTESIQVYIDGQHRGESDVPAASYYDTESVHVSIGAVQEFENEFTFVGMMQNVRMYSKPLTEDQINQLHALPAQKDVTPISGVLKYRESDTEKLILLTATDDDITEINEEFQLVILDATNGAVPSKVNNTANIIVLKSDNANGLFGFLHPCLPAEVDEGDTITCSINRTVGTEGKVTVHWIIQERYHGEVLTDGNQDFESSTGQLEFASGQLSADFTFTVLDDNEPEKLETHEVVIDSVVSHDGQISSSSYSGASIDRGYRSTGVRIRKGDNAHGIIQFLPVTHPLPNQQDQYPLATEPLVVNALEEQGTMGLLVTRAAGWHGDITIEWRTRDGTAISSQAPRDFVAAAGTLNLKDGEGYKFINITILDDDDAELEKYFFVDLLNPNGGAKLNEGSQAQIFLSPSDDAYGVYQFLPKSLAVTVYEPPTDSNVTTLQVTRIGGNLGQTVLKWRVQSDPEGDLEKTDGKVIFEFGQRNAEIEIAVLADYVPEFNEYFHVELIEVSHGVLGGTGSLLAMVSVPANDDPHGVIVFQPGIVNASEGKTNVTLTVQRKAGTFGTVRIFYKTVDPMLVNETLQGSAIADIDFPALHSSFLMRENVTITSFMIPIIDDDVPETDEAFFIQLDKVELLPSGTVMNSPRLGNAEETITRVVILENDSPNGILELSMSAITISEDWSDSGEVIVNVVRKRGTFGDVTVEVSVSPGTARPEEDYNLLSSKVTLLEGEDIKPVAISVVDDFTPELEEDFTIQLLQGSATGGAQVGVEVMCHVTIEKSDYPYGFLEISVLQSVLSEPEQSSSGAPVEFTVKRNGGLRGVSAVSWIATIEQANETEDYENAGEESGDLSSEELTDIDISSGELYFVTDQDKQYFTIKILPDDIPESDEMLIVSLDHILPSTRGVINPERNQASVKIPANDDPYGIINFESVEYRVDEVDGTDNDISIKIHRSGGLFGSLRVVYTTEEVDLMSEYLEADGADLMSFYNRPVKASQQEISSNEKQEIDTTGVAAPLKMCAEICMRQKSCSSFIYNADMYKCAWLPNSVDLENVKLQDRVKEDYHPTTNYMLYQKNTTVTDLLYDSQAKSGMDFVPVSGASVVVEEGQSSSEIVLKILDDSVPELDESFKVSLISVTVFDRKISESSAPYIGDSRSTRVTVIKNDHPYGIFILYSAALGSDFKNQTVEAEERPQLSVELVVERQDGSVGEVTVDCKVLSGTAFRNIDYIGDDVTLKFAHGETKKTISLSMIDDEIPELNEEFSMELSTTTGGAVIDESRMKVTVVILANDKVGGVITFYPQSRSVIGDEGDILKLNVTRSLPAKGECDVTWTVTAIGEGSATEGVNATSGVITFKDESTVTYLPIHLLSDDNPEIKEEYLVTLSEPISRGISSTGNAALDPQSYTATISIRGSDQPHGTFWFSEVSQKAAAEETTGTLKLFISRKFGSIGEVRVYFEIIPGTLSTMNPDVEEADPDFDFIYKSDGSDDNHPYVTFGNGVTSVPIFFTIIDDDIPELNEIFHVNLTDAYLVEKFPGIINFIPPSIDSENSLSQVIIDANDGTKGVVSFHPDYVNITVDEIQGDNATVTINIVREKGTYGEVTFFIFSQNEEAVLDKDYDCKPTTITLKDSADNVNFTVMILDDTFPEGAEKFHLLLGNPSVGLELGDRTKATITIKSNDDAHGRLSFSNEESIYINEPDNTSVNSKAKLTVVRKPVEGTYGQVSVQYRIEKADKSLSTSKNANDPGNDLFPVEGYIVINDGVDQENLEISAIMDDEPELDEIFVVKLFDPQNGATLDSDRTTTKITVYANDAPYGRFKIYPKRSRESLNRIEIKEGPGTKIIEFDVVREQGMREKVFVGIKTEMDTAVPYSEDSESPVLLSAVQTFDALWMTAYHSFEIGEIQFLVALSSDRSGPLSSTVGSSGTISNLSPGIHSTLYKYMGVFTPVQTVETDGASAATSFKSGSTTYLFITNHGRYGRLETVSRLYSVKEDGFLTVVYEVETKGATGVCHFAVEDTNYLVISNSMDNNQISSIDSSVYRFDKEEKKLTLVQTLPTRGATGVKTFTLNDDVYLAIANGHDSELDTNSLVPSVVYKWTTDEDGKQSFTQRTSVDVSHSTTVTAAEIRNDVYVLFPSYDFLGDEITTDYVDRVEVFKVMYGGPTHGVILQKHQTINSSNVVGLTCRSVSSSMLDMLSQDKRQKFGDTVHLLAVASSTESGLYWLNPGTDQFEKLVSAEDTTAMLPIAISTSYKETTLVAVAKSSDIETTEDGIVNSVIKSGIFYISNGHYGDGDYLPIMPDLVLEFEPTQTTHTIAVTVLDDEVAEDRELFKLVLDNSHDSRVEIDENQGTFDINILANDDAHGVIQFAEDSIRKAVEEMDDDNTFTLNLERSKATFGKVSVEWQADGSLSDITPLNGKVYFENGQSRAGIQITVVADDIPEVEETIQIILHSVADAGNERTELGARINASNSVAVIKILPNDSPHGIVRWSPLSLHTVISEPDTLSGIAQLVTLEIYREQGQLADIKVGFETTVAENLPAKSQARPGADYISRSDVIVIRENVTRATVAISIVPDDIPEDIETFYVKLTSVSVIGGSLFNSRPGLGPPGTDVAEITIDENDNARGFLQFNVTRNLEGAVNAFELPYVNNTLRLPVVRLVGGFRSVGVEWLAKPVSASPADFYPYTGSLHFEEDQRSADLIVYIVDDDEVEFMETFTVQLVGTTGGAKLGGDLTVTANIFPNDSPSGMFGFTATSNTVKESRTVDDPEGKVAFNVKRFQGSTEDVVLHWKLESAAMADISPNSGELHFAPGDRLKTIVFRTLPDQILEGEETYSVELVSASGGAEISPVARLAKIIIEPNHGAAGTVTVDPSSRKILTAEPTENYDGISRLLLRRGPGYFGRCYARWQITPSDANTFVNTEGEAEFEDLQNETEIVIATVNDDIPELSQKYFLRLVSATDGAEIDPEYHSVEIIVAASDSPHGTFTFSQAVYHVKEDSGNITPVTMPVGPTGAAVTTATDPATSSIISLTILRNNGHLGEVSVTVTTASGSAIQNEDFYAVSKTLVFLNGESFKVINIELLNDRIPEGPEEFFVNITDVLLLSHHSNDYFKKGTNNIALDIQPGLGDHDVTIVEIAKNDGAEGIIEFPSYLEVVEVDERNGSVMVPISRILGHYGEVSITVKTLNGTATRGLDYLAPADGTTLIFLDGQAETHAGILLVDDEEMEMEESFSLVLSGVQGGAKLGQYLIMPITIKKSDFPNGELYFLENSQRIRNPPSGGEGSRMNFFLERRGGSMGELHVQWDVIRTGPFLGDATSSTPLSEDLLPPFSGDIHFKDGEKGQRGILVNVLPTTNEQEVEEYFAIILRNTDPAEVSPTHGNVTITVMKKGNPNGVIKFANSTDMLQEVDEPNSGFTQLVFPLIRNFGTIGEVKLHWSIEGVNTDKADPALDLEKNSGQIVFRDGQANAEVLLHVIADNTPELAERFVVKLDEVYGGAEIERNDDKLEFIVMANDNPHGVFSLYSMDQQVSVLADTSRAVLVNVTRQEGAFGQVLASLNVEFDNPKASATYLTSNAVDIAFTGGTHWEVTEVVVTNNVFLAVGDTFTVKLLSVEFMDDDMTIPPRISDLNKATAVVTAEAANPQVGFDPVVSLVYNTTRNTCRMTLTRVGLYGDVTVNWAAGYTNNKLPEFAKQGQTVPASGVVSLTEGESRLNFSLTLFPKSMELEAFAVHIARVSSPIPGGAGILSNRDITQIEPCGVVGFDVFSQSVIVDEENSVVTLVIQRSYGSRYDIDVFYSTSPITAIPGRDYIPVNNGRLRIGSEDQEGKILIHLLQDDAPETIKSFAVKITDVSQTQNIYQGLSPRIYKGREESTVIIKESKDAHGVLHFDAMETVLNEESMDGSNVVVAMVTVKRAVGIFGKVSVFVSTIGGGEEWESKYLAEPESDSEGDNHMMQIARYLRIQQGIRALAGKDYEVRQINITLEEGQTEVQVPVVILDDDIPETTESFFLYLHSPLGGARVEDIHEDKPSGIMKIVILRNDSPNGRFSFASNQRAEIFEDSKSQSLDVVVRRKFAYGNVTIFWQAILDSDAMKSFHHRSTKLILAEQLESTSGQIECLKNVLNCIIRITLKQDNVPEIATWFLLELVDVSEGAEIEADGKYLNVTIADSDHPFGLFQFALKSRLPVISKGNKGVGLTINRIGGQKSDSIVHFSTEQLEKVVKVAGTTLYPAMSNIDYIRTDSTVLFKPGQKEAFVNIPLRMESSSPNPLPQLFQVKLTLVEGDGEIDNDFDTSNVTIVGNSGTKRVWRVYEALHQNLNDAVILSIVAQLQSIADNPMDKEQVTIFHGTLSTIVSQARQRPLPHSVLSNIYELFCKLLDPYRVDSVMGFTEFSKTFEQFAFSLLTDSECVAAETDPVIYRKCMHAIIQSARWYPELVNGYTFVGKGRTGTADIFKVPHDLLDVQSTGVDSPSPTCYDITFIEYLSQVWFSISGETGAMSNKVFSVSIDGHVMSGLVSPVNYRIHTSDARISPKGSECVLWNEASSRWLNPIDVCHVVDDTDSYVDCACHHMSVYAVRGPTDNLTGYNEATYVSCFICAVAAAFIILGHHVCASQTTFASKLMMHMCFACGITQLVFVISTLTSEDANADSCSAIGIFLHYFWVSQFTWTLVQVINIWKVFVLGNEHPSKLYLVYFIVGWGLPAIIVLLHSITMYALDFTSIQEIYGDVHDNGDMCFILNPKAALCSAVLPACLCIMVAVAVGLQLYQRDKSWQQYDDIFRGRFNKSEIPLLFWFFFLLSMTWLWGGLHLTFGQMWMLVFFILFNMVQGFYLLIVYGILHNQLVRPIKSSYEFGEAGTSNTVYETSAVGSGVPSLSGDVMNRSTQDLVPKDDEMDWGNNDESFMRSHPLSHDKLDSSFCGHDESADFDDLMFALKSGLTDSNQPEDSKVMSKSPLKSSNLLPIQHSLEVIDDVTDDDELQSDSSISDTDLQQGSYPIADTHL